MRKFNFVWAIKLSTFLLATLWTMGNQVFAGDVSSSDCERLALGLLGDDYKCSNFSKVCDEAGYIKCKNDDGDVQYVLCAIDTETTAFSSKDDAKDAARSICDSSGERDRDRSGDDDSRERDRDRSKEKEDKCKKIRDKYKEAKNGSGQSGTADEWQRQWDDNCSMFGSIDSPDFSVDFDIDVGGSVGGDYDFSISSGGSRSGGSYDGSISGEYVYRRDSDVDCIDCTIYRGYQESKASGTADIITAIGFGLGQVAGPLSSVWSNHIWASAYEDVNSEWALAARRAQYLCTQRYDNYLGHIDAYGGSPVSADDAIALSRTCNGAPTYAYAGMSGMMGMGMYGGVGNPWLSAGYSPGFLSGMMGPYGMSGGINMGMSYPGYGYGYPYGGTGFGMSGYLGVGGFPPYLSGTWGMGGYMGAGGYGGMGYPGYGTYPGAGGFSGGISFGLGAGAGYGYNPYYSGGMMGGYGVGSGVMPYGWGGGSYWNNSGGWGDAYSQWQTAYQQQMSYQQQMAAVGARTQYDMYGNMYGNMALQQSAYNTMSGYGGAYGGMYGNPYYGNPYYSPYGGSGYGMGGISGSFGFGFGF